MIDSRTARRIAFQTGSAEDLNAKYQALGFELHERLDAFSRGLVEGICKHGVGHPIPESIKERDHNGPPGATGSWAIHGCDGCCREFPVPPTDGQPEPDGSRGQLQRAA